MYRERGKPRVIRKVVKKDAKGRAKLARDGKAQIDMERYTARVPRDCFYRKCPMPDRQITPGTEYARVTDYVNGPIQSIGRRSVAQGRDFHFDCVPPEARPLVRLLVPMNWRMLLCDRDSRGPLVVRWFTSPAAWEAWIRHNHYGMVGEHHYRSNTVEQFGTNDYWSALYHEPRFQKPKEGVAP